MTGDAPHPEQPGIAYLDCASGISGDKFLAACLDAGADTGAASSAIGALGIGARLQCHEVTRGGLRGMSVLVAGPASPSERTWADIRALLEGASLKSEIADGALRVFRLLAEVEARVHNTAVDDVHFHEIGAVDTIADIVGGVAAFASLEIEHLVCSPVAVGSGTIDTSHGPLPIPAPATLELLRGVPVIPGQGEGELTTPTGAALVRVLASDFGAFPAMIPRAIGYGAGTRETETPNLARLVLGSTVHVDDRSTPSVLSVPTVRLLSQDATLLVTNLDHITPEHAAFACEELLSEGALDVWQTPAAMKKGRLGFELRVLATPSEVPRLASRIAELTGTLGVRIEQTPRRISERTSVEVETSLGRVRAKSGAPGAERVRVEYDDVARIARATGRRYDEIARTLAEEVRRSIADMTGPDDD